MASTTVSCDTTGVGVTIAGGCVAGFGFGVFEEPFGVASATASGDVAMGRGVAHHRRQNLRLFLTQKSKKGETGTKAFCYQEKNKEKGTWAA
jgi:hypothetical protein